jgi:hypothetical protein
MSYHILVSIAESKGGQPGVRRQRPTVDGKLDQGADSQARELDLEVRGDILPPLGVGPGITHSCLEVGNW